VLATEVTAGTPPNTVVTPVAVAVAVADRVSVLVPLPEVTVVPEGIPAPVTVTLVPPTRPLAFTMSMGKLPPAVSVIWLDPDVVLTARLAAQLLFGAARPSAGVPMDGAAEVSLRRGNPKTVEMVFVISASKLLPVELSRFLLKFVFESQTQLRNPPVDARIVVGR
jgi:hypothetical protein